MPPAISDDERSSSQDIPDQIPARETKADEPTHDEQEDEDEDGDDDDEDEYRVEKILKHDFAEDGSALYQIKWLGYDDPTDMTWEPVENLVGSQDTLNAYHKKIGGPPEPPSTSVKKGKKGGKRSVADAFADSPAPASNKKKSGGGRRSTNGAAAAVQDEDPGKRVLPQGSWDDVVLRVTSIIEESVANTRGKEETQLIGLLEWKGQGPKTQHKMKVLRQKVPQRLLDYYEQHLVFTNLPKTDDRRDDAQ